MDGFRFISLVIFATGDTALEAAERSYDPSGPVNHAEPKETLHLRRPGESYICPTCGYSLNNLPSNARCPECSTKYFGSRLRPIPPYPSQTRAILVVASPLLPVVTLAAGMWLYPPGLLFFACVWIAVAMLAWIPANNLAARYYPVIGDLRRRSRVLRGMGLPVVVVHWVTMVCVCAPAVLQLCILVLSWLLRVRQ